MSISATYFVPPHRDCVALVSRITITNAGTDALTLCALDGLAIIIGVLPPVLKIFQIGLKKGSFGNNSVLHGVVNIDIV